jgi:hypothetical protein
MWFSVTLKMNFVGSDEGSRSGSERIDSPPMLHADKVVLCAALTRGGTERVKIGRAVHESDCGHRRGEVK